jgi:hypothetical protein
MVVGGVARAKKVNRKKPGRVAFSASRGCQM